MYGSHPHVCVLALVAYLGVVCADEVDIFCFLIGQFLFCNESNYTHGARIVARLVKYGIDFI